MTLDVSVLHRLEALRVCNADESVVRDLEDRLEVGFAADAIEAFQRKEWPAALRSACLALLVSGRVDRRPEKLRMAWQALSAGAWNIEEIDSIDVIGDPLFEPAKRELREAERVRVAAELQQEFRRLDSSSALWNKRFDELGRLAEMLEVNGAGADPVVRLRLLREREAQEKFRSIRDRLVEISKSASHADRTETIHAEVWAAASEAVDLAAGANPAYGNEIAVFVTEIEELLARADAARTKHEVSHNAHVLRDQALSRLKDALCAELDVVEAVAAICRAFEELCGTPASTEVLEHSQHWLVEKARLLYQALAASNHDAARHALTRSRLVLEENRRVLPKSFLEEISQFLAAFEVQLRPVVAPPQEARQPAASPRRTPLLDWLRAMWRVWR